MKRSNILCGDWKNQKLPMLKDNYDRFMEPGDLRHGPLQQRTGEDFHRKSVQDLDGILLESHTVDGRNPEPAEVKVVHPIIYKAFFIHPRWFSRRISEPSTVSFNHPAGGFQPHPVD